MSKLKDNVTLSVVLGEGESFKKGTAKQALLEMSIELNTFTKAEWLAKAAELYDTGVIAHSLIYEKRGTTGWGKAWFNEFYNKHKVFQVVEHSS